MKHGSAVIIGSFVAMPIYGQLTITDSLNTGDLSTLLEGLNVTITNVEVNCPQAAMGHFTGTSEMGITEGLMVTTGTAEGIAGPSSTAVSVFNGTPGDADLEAELGQSGNTYDGCALEFDCIPLGDTLLFNFSFGSEEYQEFVGSAFNDAFAIYLSGPGFDVPTNVAALPNGTLVSINNVNEINNAGFYHNNEVPPGQYVGYDGFTTNLTAFAVVQPGEDYHFKVVVVDVADGVFDSGVFLEAFSFRSVFGLSTGLQETVLPQLAVRAFGTGLLLEASGLPGGEAFAVNDMAGRLVLAGRLAGERTHVDLTGVPEGALIVRLPGRAEVPPQRVLVVR